MARKRRGRGEGSIYQRADGLWVASASAGYNAKGKRDRKTAYGKTKREAQAKLRTLLDDTSDGNVERLTVAQHITRWLGSKKVKVAPTTHRRYAGLARMHVMPHVGHYRLGDLRPYHVVKLYAELEKAGESANTRHKAGGLLFSAMRNAVKLR